jgi:hypothetical protein
MSLLDLDIKSRANQWDKDTGGEQWIVQYSLPNTRIVAEELNYRVSMANLLPWADAADVYAPCIHRSSIVPDPEDANSQLLTCTYQRPSDRMLLQPGRGIMRFSSYTTTQKEETGVFRDGRDVTLQGATATTSGFASWTNSLETRDRLIIVERNVLVLIVADWAINEPALFDRADAWNGYGGEFTIKDRLWDNLKCAKADIQRKESDASIVFSTWQFARNPEGWTLDGIINETYFATDMQGNLVTYDPVTHTARAAGGPTLTQGQFLSMKVRKTDPEVIKGTVDFAAVEDYFKWNK